MDKSPEAFRTISEVADWLGVPTHVLRFWESRFTQLKPVKRAGGRRYYRPADMALLGGIKKLLHEDGLTIRGVQKVLREKGVKHVAGLAPALDGSAPAEVAPAVAEAGAAPTAASPDAEEPAKTATPGAPAADDSTAAGDDPDSALQRFPFVDEPQMAEAEAETGAAKGDAEDTAAGATADEAVVPFVADVPETDPADDAPDVAIRPVLPNMMAPALARRMPPRRPELLAIQKRLAALKARRNGQPAQTPAQTDDA